MKPIYSTLVLLLIAVIAVNATLKESQKQKHDQQKNHNKKPAATSFGHKTSKLEHHAVKEVLKHAPHVITHHEAKLQLDLGHGAAGSKKPLGPSSSRGVDGSTSLHDLKLQDIMLEDKIHKIQSHKLHRDTPKADGHGHLLDDKASLSSATVHGYKNGHPKSSSSSMSVRGSRFNNGGRATDKKLQDKKRSKKVLNSSKAKKYKRAKRLHKFIW